MIASALILFSLCAHAGGTDALSQAKFTLERQGFYVEPAKQAITIDPQGPDLVFKLVTSAQLDGETRVQASLIGPALATPLAVDQAASNGKIVLDRQWFDQEGIYQLTQIRLVRNEQVLELANPASAEIQVAEKFIVTDVVVRELTQAELAEKGYVFNESDYISVNFSLKFQVESQREVVAIDIPVVFPRFENSLFVPRVIEDPFHPFVIAIPTFPSKTRDKSGSFLGDLGGAGGNPSKRIPGLILIPGNFKYLKSHFDVTVLTLNAAPSGFDVRVNDLQAQLVLPGPVSSGELPITIAEPTQKLMVNLGEDGEPGTADDRGYILPGERANTDYVVTGNLPGIHDIEILISGNVDLPQGREKVYSSAKSTIYVRSPEFAVTFEHPDVVVEDEPFDLVVHIQNKGEVDLADFTMTLDPDRLVGVALAGTHPVQNAGTIPRGGEGTVTYHLRSLQTGAVKSGFFKAAHSIDNSIQMRVGVGKIGERLSPYVLEFPEIFRTRFPAPLVQMLEGYAKRALDVALSGEEELPADLSAVSPAAVREFNRSMALIAASDDYGNPLPQRLLQLFSQWARSLKDYGPLDQVRRKIIREHVLELEQAFGAELAQAFPSTSSESLLTQLAQENEGTPGLFAYLVEADGPLELTVRDGLELATTSAGQRDIPFSSIVPLGSNKTLIWLSAQKTVPNLELTAAGTRQVTLHALFPASRRQWLATTQLELVSSLSIALDPAAATLTVRVPGQPNRLVPAAAVPVKPLELLTIKQADPASTASADVLGRSQILYFSKPIDLTSIVPLSDHLTIGGLPVVEGILQKDGRTLIVSSKIPLGPYRPIAYSISGLKSLDGEVLPDSAGTYEGNPYFVGVTVRGRVVDRNGRDLTQAKVFLWIREREENPELRRRAARGELVEENSEVIFRILSQKTLTAEDSYLFEYAPFVPFEVGTELAERFHQFKVGILMPDGLYEERTITPLGAGQDIVVDFSFLAQGSVQGYVRHADGTPVPFAQVVAISQHNAQSGGLTQADGNGYYRVDHVEVGQVVVKSAEHGTIGYGSGYLTSELSPLQIDVVIDRPTARLVGTVTTDVDGSVVPVEGAHVGFATQGTVVNYILLDQHPVAYSNYTTTDAQGHYVLDQVPAGDGELWFYHPHFDLANRPLILPPGSTTSADHNFPEVIEPIGVITGVVHDMRGQPIAGAELAISLPEQYASSDATGHFTLRYLQMGRSLTLRISHPDYRNTKLQVFLSTEHLDNLVIVMPDPLTVTGEYLTASGDPVPYAMVYLEGAYLGGGFAQSKIVAQTRYDGTWTAELESDGELHFSGYRPPAVASTRLTVHGGEHVILAELPTRDLRVRLLDSHGQGVVAKVFLKSTGPISNPIGLGEAGLLERAPVFTDEHGYATFPHQNVGPFEVYGKLNDLGQTPVLSSVLETTPDGSPLEVSLRFPIAEEEANLFGTIFEADGTPAPPGTVVKVQVGGQTGIRICDALGNFRFDELVTTSEPQRVAVLAYNPVTSHYENTYIDLHQDLNFRLDLTLRRKGTLHVRVIQGDGEPADFAAVAVDFANIEYTPPVGGEDPDPALATTRKEGQITPSNSEFVVADMPTGPFIIRASSGNGFRGLRAYAMPLEGGDLEVVVRLEASSQISGIFLDPSEVPIADAEIQLYGTDGLLGQRLSSRLAGEEGHFTFPDLPMRTYTLRGTDPSTNLKAHLEVTTSPFLPDPFVELRLDPVAHLEGVVYQEDQVVPGALVTLVSGGIKVLTGTDAEGRYRFANLPLRTYKITATKPVIPGSVTGTAQLSESGATVTRDLHYAPTIDLDLYVEASDGTPAQNVLVSVYNAAYSQHIANSAFTDEQGHALIQQLLPGAYAMSAEHPAELAPIYKHLVLSASEGSQIQRQIAFPGWGTISGTVSDAEGHPLTQSITVHLDLSGTATAVATDAAGQFRIGKVPLERPIHLTALNPATREVATATVRLDHHGEEAETALRFHGSTNVSGTVTLQNGQPASLVTVRLTGDYALTSQTDLYGHYRFEPVLEGSYTVIASDPRSPRKAARDLVVHAEPGQLPEPVENVDMVMSGVGQVLGRVLYSDGSIVPYATIKLVNSRLRATLTATLQGDGSFVFAQVPAGSWNLSAYDDTYALASPNTTVLLEQDGQVLQQDVVFPPSFALSGLLIGPDRLTPVAGGRVKLWRPNDANPQQYDLIYSALSDDQGAYHLDHVYPGTYLIEGDDPELLMNYKAPLLMPNQNTQRDVFLENETWVQGTLTDATGKLFRHGTITLTQLGRTYYAALQNTGSFSFRGLSAGPCVLAWEVAGGWVQGSRNELLGTGINRPAIVTGDTVTLSGRAILAKLPPSHPGVSMTVAGIAKSLQLNASGDWLVDEVPAGAAAKLNLHYGSAKRSYSLGSFTSSQDLGTFWLDATGPALQFADAGATVTTSPYRLSFQVGEGDPESLLVPAKTTVWLNGAEVSSAFTTTQTEIFADFAYFDGRFLLGNNTVVVEAANNSNLLTRKTFSFNLQLQGTTLAVRLRNNGVPVVGEFKLGDSDYVASDAEGILVIADVAPGTYLLKARAPSLGLRDQLTVTRAVQQNLDLALGFVGEYRGRVLGLDGNPAAGVTVQLGSAEATSDAEGNYSVDLLPLGEYTATASAQGTFAYRVLPELNLPGQVRLATDIQLEGSGAVEGLVRDDDGTRTIAGATVELSFASLPDSYKRQLTANAEGRFRFEGVPMRALTLAAFDPASKRGGLAQGLIPEAGATLELDVALSPSGDITAQVLDLQGDPVPNLFVTASGNGLTFTATTAADGRFSMTELPYRTYSFSADRIETSEYLLSSQQVDQASQDLGTLTMRLDQAPTVLSTTIPNPYDPLVNATLALKFNDDRQLDRYTLVTTGAFAKTLNGDLSSTTASAFPRLGTTAATPDGHVDYTLTVTDKRGHSSQKTGGFEILRDTVAPQLSISKPLEGAAVAESTNFSFEVDASDPSGIERLTFLMDGAVLGSSTQAPFKRTVRAPAVTADRQVLLRAEARDNRGNLAIDERTLTVRAVQTSGAPNLSLTCPIDGLRLPLDLPQGLDLQVQAELDDVDGLAEVTILLDGQALYTGALSGTHQTLDQSLTVPEALRGAATLVLEVRASDIGGNTASTSVTLLRLDTPYQVFAADHPLRLVGYDLSLQDQSLVLAGGSHTIDGKHRFRDLILVNGASLSQTTTSTDQAYVAHTDVTTTASCVIDLHSVINVDGKGYAGLPDELGLGYGAPSHGGLGRGTSDLRQIYDSPFQPTLPGARRGGGAVKLAAAEIWLLGQVRANAGSDGAGGSIWLEALRFEGHGKVTANGYRDAYADTTYGGGGGRIAIYGTFAGTVEAYGGKDCGAGTIFTRVPDPSQPDGSFDRLLVKAHADAQPNAVNLTALPVLEDLVVGTDLVFSTQYRANQAYQVADMYQTQRLGAFVGMRFFDANGPSASVVASQEATRFWSAPEASFGTYANGTHLALSYLVDELAITQGARFSLEGVSPRSPLSVDHATVLGGSQPVQLVTATTQLGPDSVLQGDFSLSELPLPQTGSVTLIGSASLDRLSLAGQTLFLDGRLSAATSIAVAADAAIVAPADGTSAHLVLQAPTLTIAGDILAKSAGEGLTGAYALAHGGLGGGSFSGKKTYDSLYHPSHGGSVNAAGGSIQLAFTDCTLDGHLDVSPTNDGSGGAILLQGQTLQGSGTLAANGQNHSYYCGAGGRIALLVDHVEGFSGSASAYGGANNQLDRAGAAGTVYWRTAAWPNGKLVVDNAGVSTKAGSTLLPGLGSRTVAAATGGPTLAGTGFPELDSLVGLYVDIPGSPLVRIASHTTSALQGETPFPALAAGDSYRGRHILDVLEVRGHANLKSIDTVEVLQDVVIDQAAIDIPDFIIPDTTVFRDGSLELFSDPGIENLELDNFALTTHFPLRLGHLQLINGAVLRYDEPITVTGPVTLDHASLYAQVEGPALGLTANAVTLTNGSGWYVADRKSTGEAFPILARIDGDFILDATSVVSTSGAAKVDTRATTWAGTTWSSGSHGGFSGLGGSPNERPVLDSFANPKLYGGVNGGGVIRIAAASMALDGQIAADGYDDGAGGAIRLDAEQFSGSGRIDAKSGQNGGGGGRIALYYGQDSSFLTDLRFDLGAGNPNPSYSSDIGGAGTLFTKGANQSAGELIVDQHASLAANRALYRERHRLTGVTGMASLTMNLADTDARPEVVADPSWPLLPPGLEGLRLELIVDGSAYDAVVVDNSHNSITLDRPVPAVVPAGTTLDFILALDRLTLRDGAQFHFPGIIDAAEITQTDTVFTSIWAKALRHLPNPLVVENHDQRLILDDRQLGDQDILVRNATLYLDRPLVLRDLTLDQASVSESFSSVETPASVLQGSIDLSLRNLTMDASSTIDASLSHKDADNWNHGGVGLPTDGTTFGNLFQPTTFGKGGRAGGKIHVVAERVSGGSFLANAEGGGGGSIWIETAVLEGNVAAKAYPVRSSGGGGRIAIYAADASGAQLTTRASGTVSAGTVYSASALDQPGTLTIDNFGATASGPWNNVTPIPVFATTTLTSAASATYDPAHQTTTLTVPGLTPSMDFVGYHLAVKGQYRRRWPILASVKSGANTVFTLGGDASSLVAGEIIVPALKLKALERCSICELQPADLMILEDQAPVITAFQVSGFIHGTLPAGRPFTVQLAASDNFAVTGASFQIDAASLVLTGSGPFQGSLIAPALPGDYTLVATAFDLNGNAAIVEQVVTVADFSGDTAGPVIELLAPNAGATVNHLSELAFQFRASDQSEVQQLRLTFGSFPTVTIAAPESGRLETASFSLPYVENDTDLPFLIEASDGLGQASNLTGQITVHHPTDAELLPRPTTYLTFDNRDLAAEIPRDVLGGMQITCNYGTNGVTGKVGQALDFSGASPSSLISKSYGELTATSRFSFSIWTKMDTIVDYGGIITLGDWLGQSQLRLCQRNGNIVELAMGGNAISTPVTTNRWYHFAATFDGGIATFYVDGVKLGTQTFTMPVATKPTLTLGVEHPGTVLQYLNGQVDEFALFQTVLDDQQVQTLYQLGQAGKTLDFRPPQDVTALGVEVTSTSLDLHWTGSADDDGDLAGYRLTLDGGTPIALPVGTSQHSLTGLAPASIHSVRITAVDRGGSESVGAELVAITLDAANLPIMPTEPLTSFSLDTASISGTTAQGRQGGVNGTLSGAVANSAGQTGQCLSFDGVNDYVSLTATTAMNNLQLGNYTLSAWFKPASMPANVYKGIDATENSDNSYSYGIIQKQGQHTGLRFNSHVTFEHWFSDVTHVLPRSSVLLPGRYYHAVGVLDRDHGIARLYIDGKEVASATFTAGKAGRGLGTNPWKLGTAVSNGSTFRWPMKGLIDEAAVWDRALSAEEVAGLYQVTRKQIEPDCYAPEPITSLQFTPGHDRIAVSWTASANSRGDLAGYHIRRDNGAWVFIGAPATTYTFTGLTPSTPYGVELRAIDRNGVVSTLVAGQTNTTLLDTQAPQLQDLVVSNLVGGEMPQGQTFTVSFSANDNLVVAGARLSFDGQNLEQSGAGPFNFALTAPTTSGDVPLHVEAFDGSGNLASQDLTLHVRDIDITPPLIELLAPTANAVVDMGSEVSFSFRASDASGLQSLSLSFDAGTPISIDAPASGRLETVVLTMPQVTEDVTYSYRLEASDPGGNSTSQSGQLTVRYVAPDSLPAPYAYWPFDGGDLPTDVRGHAQVRYSYASLGYNGKVNEAVGFEGYEPSNIVVEQLPVIAPDTSFTLSTWTRMSSFSDNAGLICYGDWLGAAVFRLVQRTSTGSGNVIAFEAAGETLQTPELQTGQWYHLALTYTPGTATLYLDGQLVSSASLTLPTTAAPVLCLGVEQTGQDLEYFVGRLDELAFWPSQLGAGQIDQLYQLGQQFLQLFYPLTEVFNLSSATTPDAAELTWDQAEFDRLAAYHLYRDDETGYQALLPSATSATVTGLAAGSQHRFRLTSVDASGNESPGVTIVAVTRDEGDYPVMPPGALASFSLDANTVVGLSSVQGRQPGMSGSLFETETEYDGRVAEALRFDGYDDAVTLVNPPALDQLQYGNYTLSLWFRPFSMPQTLYLGSDSDDNNARFGLLNKGPHQGLSFDSGISLHHGFADQTRITLNSPHLVPYRIYHAVAVIDRDHGKANLYLDGQLVASADFEPGKLAADLAAQPWTIGCASPNAESMRWPLYGWIDEVGLWDQALSAEQVAGLYQVAKHGQEPDTLAPEPPTDLVIAPASDQLQLTWTASANSRGDLAGYKLRLDQGPWTYLDASATMHSFAGLAPSTLYAVELLAVDSNGVPSAAVSAQATTLAPPKRLSTTTAVTNLPPALARWLTPAGDLEIHGERIVVDNLVVPGRIYLVGTTLVVRGTLQAQSLHLRSGAVLTSAHRADGAFQPLVLRLAENVEVAPDARIDLDGLGLRETEPLHLSHGGLADGATLADLLDAPLYPILPGGGQAGGGALYLQAAQLVLNGTLSARGLGLSAGGAVQLHLGELAGQGLIDVSGGQTEQVHAGGGRVAIHAPRRHRFLGTVTTGDLPDNQGSLILVDGPQAFPLVGHAWPLAERAETLALLPARVLEADEIEGYLVNQLGTLVVLHSQQDPSAYTGFWLEHGGVRYRLLAVQATSAGRYLLQLDRHLGHPTLAGAAFVLPTATTPAPIPAEAAVALPQP